MTLTDNDDGSVTVVVAPNLLTLAAKQTTAASLTSAEAYAMRAALAVRDAAHEPENVERRRRISLILPSTLERRAL